MFEWTSLDSIKKVNIHFNNGDDLQVYVKVIVVTFDGSPSWLVYLDDMSCEVIVPWGAIRDLTILERH